jgi:hypothetical protein
MSHTVPSASAVAEVGGWGPFFTVERHDVPPPGWRPVRELADDPQVLADRVAAVRAYLASGGGRVPVRVAASVTQLGVVARLVAPSLGLAVHSGRFLGVADACWRSELGGAFPLSVTGRATDSPAELIGVVRGIVDATRVFSVSDRVLWGNVASAVNGAAMMVAVARPDLAARATAVADDVLRLPPLRGTGVRHPDGRFQRRSCCLIYRASPTGGRAAVCGDCVLAGGH